MRFGGCDSSQGSPRPARADHRNPRKDPHERGDGRRPPEVEELDVQINPDDLVVDTMRAGGPGGQKVNKTESAVRITHTPSGIVVKCQDNKSQHRNRATALRILRARLAEHEERERDRKRAAERKSQIGSGDRNERIRTYNFPQSRVTDHRIGLTLYNLPDVMQGSWERSSTRSRRPTSRIA